MQFQTKNTLYTLTQDGNGDYLISGHPTYCPFPVKCEFKVFPAVGERFICTTHDSRLHPHDRFFRTTPVVKVIP